MPQQPAQSAASHGQDFQTDGRAHEYRHHRGWQSDREFRQRWWHREHGSWSATATSASWASPTPPAARDAPNATAPSAALADPSTPASPRSHTAAINAVATANQIDESATIQLHSADTRIAAYIMSLGPLASARSPSAAIANRYPRRQAARCRYGWTSTYPRATCRPCPLTHLHWRSPQRHSREGRPRQRRRRHPIRSHHPPRRHFRY